MRKKRDEETARCAGKDRAGVLRRVETSIFNIGIAIQDTMGEVL